VGRATTDRAAVVKCAALFSGAMLNSYLRARLSVPLQLVPTWVRHVFSPHGWQDVSNPLQWLHRAKTVSFILWLECKHRLNIADAGGPTAVQEKPERMFKDALPHLQHLAEDVDRKRNQREGEASGSSREVSECVRFVLLSFVVLCLCLLSLFFVLVVVVVFCLLSFVLVFCPCLCLCLYFCPCFLSLSLSLSLLLSLSFVSVFVLVKRVR
jgi:hypothetical protein